MKLTDAFIEECCAAIMAKRRVAEPEKYKQDWPEFIISNPERAEVWRSDTRFGLEVVIPMLCSYRLEDS